MTKRETRILLILFLILSILTGVILTRYYFKMKVLSSPNPEEVAEAMTGDELPGGYRVITATSQLSKSTSGSKSVCSRTFTHKVFSPAGVYLVTLEVSVTGEAEGESVSIASVNPQFSDEQTDGLTLSQHLSGDTGTVVLYRNQVSVCHFQYRLSSDGMLDFLK